MEPSRRTSFLAFSCTHCPLHDPESKRWLLSRIAEIRPKVVIHLGDLFEASAASRWSNEDEWTLLEEYRVGAEYLRDVREAAGPDSTFVWCLGNHDDNLQQENRLPKALRGVAHWTQNRWMGPEVEHWKVAPYRHESGYRLGPVTFHHGAEHGVNSNRDQCVLYAPEYGLFVSGHTHRPMPVTQAMLTSRVPLKKWYANAGTMSDWDRLDYMDRRSKATWGAAIVAGEANAKQCRAAFRSVQWNARVEILKTGLP